MGLQRLFFIYLAAICVLFVSLTASIFFTEGAAFEVEDNANLLNVSGRQRMLSQRIIYLASNLEALRALDAPTRGRTTADLNAAITRFETAHTMLTADAAGKSALSALYFDDSAEQKSLDQRVQNYIAAARDVATNAPDTQGLAQLSQIERAGLLQDLDRVVSATETASVKGLGQIRDLGWFSMLLGVVIIFVEVVFVFLPGHRFILGTHTQLKLRNVQLDAARSKLDAKNADLATKNQQIAIDKERIHDAWQESETLRKEQAEFTYAVSHDLKSPANTMHLLLNELKSDPSLSTSKDADTLLSMAVQTAQRMEVQIEDVLQYCWSTDRKNPPTQIDLDEILQDVLDDLDYEISQTEAEITYDNLPSFFGYGPQIRVLLNHLIANGIKFRTPDDTPKIHIAGTTGNPLVITVEDNGIGIRPEDHARIFGMFQRLHVRETYEGSGLGLATCHRIARNHDGSIEVSSIEGGGSRFTVTLNSRTESNAPRAQFPNLNTKDAA